MGDENSDNSLEMNRLVLVAIILSGLFGSPEHARAQCDGRSLISKLKAVLSPTRGKIEKPIARKAFQDLPDPSTYPLPQTMIDAIHSHSIQDLKKTYGDGTGYVLILQHFTPGSDVKSAAFGESIQAKFVAKVLQEVFPALEIVPPQPDLNLDGAWDRYYPGKKRLFLGIDDRSESDWHTSNRALNMPFIKAANPGMASLPHNELRQSLGIARESFVTSLYLKGDEKLNLRPILSQIEQQGHPDIVFLSFGGNDNSKSLSTIAKTAGPGYEICLLSEFSKLVRRPGAHYLVLNDLRGKMPQIYNVADVSVVMGPINLFEPLTGGSPLVFFNNRQVLGDYSKSAFGTMAQTALKTGGAVEISDVSQLSRAVAQVKGKPPTLAPYMAPVQPYGDVSGRSRPSSLDVFLGHLKAKLRQTFERM